MEITPKKITENIPFNFDWNYGVELFEIKKDIEELEKLGATHLHIELEEPYGYPTIVISATKERFETYSEVRKRIDNEELIKQKNKEIAIAQIDRLKKQYGI